MPQEGSSTILIAYIGEVEQPDSDLEFELINSQVSNAQIIGVTQLVLYMACLRQRLNHLHSSLADA